MKIIIFGAPGSGKSTQAKILSKKLNIPHISTGDLVRAENGSLKKEITHVLSKGKLVSDKTIYKIFEKRISKPDCKAGFILDGFPRNITQAKKLKKMIKINKIFEINISYKESVKRLSKRKRKDETFNIVKERLKIYKKQTKPIFNYYKEILIKINGEQSVQEIAKDISKSFI